MTLTLQREPTAYRSLMKRLGVVVADPEPMLARLVRGCIALAFTAWNASKPRAARCLG